MFRVALISMVWLIAAAPTPSQDIPVNQITAESSVATVITGADEFFKAGSVIVVPEGNEIKLSKAGLIKYTGLEGYDAIVKGFDSNRVPVVVEKVGDYAYVVTGSGTVWVDLTAINWEDKDLQSVTTQIDLGGTPPKPPPGPDEPDEPDNPNPDDTSVPEDDFGNVGRKVNGWATGLPGRIPMAGHYKKASDQLISDYSKTIDDIGGLLSTSLSMEPDFEDYGDFFDQLNKDLESQYPFTDSLNSPRVALSNYYKAVAAGLEAGQ